MNDDYGHKVGAALLAIQQLHGDCSRLLLDADKLMGNWIAIHGTYVTSNLSWDVKRGFYMAEGLYRHYANANKPNCVRSIITCFGSNREPIPEPLLLLSELKYVSGSPTKGTVAGVWDPWALYFAEDREHNKLIRFDAPYKAINISTAKLTGFPLYSLKSKADLSDALLQFFEPTQ
jgi:hypothetical protein